MSFWVLVQIFINLILLAAVGFIWVRLSRPAKDDPRLSRGLQLLQSKISVLEDLSDRTETQVTQLTSLMEQKCRDIQGSIQQAEKQVQRIEASMSKSLEVAKIFQDKIPHQEIIERQNALKYIKAARLAHRGHAVDEIATQVDLSQGEIEFISKVNRERLQFSEEDLPVWAQEEVQDRDLSNREITGTLISSNLNPQATDLVSQTLSHLGSQFRQATNQQTNQFAGQVEQPSLHPSPQQSQQPSLYQSPHPSQQPLIGNEPHLVPQAMPQKVVEPEPIVVSAAQTPKTAIQQDPSNQVMQKFQKQNANTKLRDSAATVRKVVFPRIDGNDTFR